MNNLREHIVFDLVENLQGDKVFSAERLLKTMDNLSQNWSVSAPQMLRVIARNKESYPFLDKMADMTPLSSEWVKSIADLLDALNKKAELR